MGLNFRKSISICKGVKLNIGKSGVGVSVGTKGAHYSMNTSGRRSATVGIPGTGLSYTKNFSNAKKKTSTASKKSSSEATAKKAELERKKAELENAKADEAAQNALKVEEAENYIELIKSVHKECENDINWEAAASSPAPFEKGTKGPLTAQAEKNISEYKPGFSEKLFKSKVEEKQKQLDTELENAIKADNEAYSEWEEGTEFAKRVLEGDIDAYLDAINAANPFEDLTEYGSGFEFGTDDPDIMEIEFTVKADEVVPKNTVSLLKSGKLSEKEMSKTAYYDLVQDYVCSCSIRLAREIFAIIPVKAVIVHAVDSIIDPSTGNDTDSTILSVAFDREKFDVINFDRIDPSDCVGSFPCNMSFSKIAGFKQVTRLSR